MITLFILSILCSDINHMKKYHIGPKYTSLGINLDTTTGDIVASKYRGEIAIQPSNDDGVKLVLNGMYLCRDNDKLVLCKDQSLNSNIFQSEDYIFRIKPKLGGYRIKSPSRLFNSSSLFRSLTQVCLEYNSNKKRLKFKNCKEIAEQIFDLEEVRVGNWFENSLNKIPGEPSNEDQNIQEMYQSKGLPEDQYNSLGSKYSGSSMNIHNLSMATQIASDIFNNKPINEHVKVNVLRELFGSGTPTYPVVRDDEYSKYDIVKSRIVDDYLNNRLINENDRRRILDSNVLSGSPSDRAIDAILNGRPINEEARRHLINNPLSNTSRDKAFRDILWNGNPSRDVAKRLLLVNALSNGLGDVSIKEILNDRAIRAMVDVLNNAYDGPSQAYNEVYRGSPDEVARRHSFDSMSMLHPNMNSNRGQMMGSGNFGGQNSPGPCNNMAPCYSSFRNLCSVSNPTYKVMSASHGDLPRVYTPTLIPVPISGYYNVPQGQRMGGSAPLQNL